MATDTNLLLSLVAVRLLGGQSVPADSPALKALKKLVKDAADQGLLREHKIKVPSTNKAGKTTTKNQPVLDLTDEGNRVLHQEAGADVLAATAAGQLSALRQGLEADRQALRQEATAALAAKGKGKGEGVSGKELAGLAKTVSDLATRLQKLETAVQAAGPDDQILSRIDQAFEALSSRLDRALEGLPSPGSAPAPPQPSAPPRVPEEPTTPQTSLRDVLREVYRRLSSFRSSQDGLIELRSLYHNARQSVPSLSADDFRREVQALWESREVELHILNEVREAKEPETAIRRDDKLYYYIYWPNA